MTDNKWVKVGSEQDFVRGLHVVTHGRRRFVITRLDGRWFAFDALCPHAQGPMERVEIEGTIVSCPLHAWRFDLDKNGKELHGYRDLTVKPVKIENGVVYLGLAS